MHVSGSFGAPMVSSHHGVLLLGGDLISHKIRCTFLLIRNVVDFESILGSHYPPTDLCGCVGWCQDGEDNPKTRGHQGLDT